MTTALSVSLVLYRPDVALLRDTLTSLRQSLLHARDAGALDRATVTVVDNGTPDESALDALCREEVSLPWTALRIVRGHGNVGYGRGHNLAILSSDATYHLVMNPDVVVAPEAVLEAIEYLRMNPDVGLLTPGVRGPDGERQYLCREYPTVAVLFLRGFAPRFVRNVFRRYLDAHELRQLIGESALKGIPLVSGCFMFTRLEALRTVGGFSPDYFVYFEDFDLSLRLGRVAQLAYVPAVRIMHYGGNSARKGVRHIVLFTRGAATFFRTHGWKLV